METILSSTWKQNCPTNKINLLTRKGVYPYSFVDSFARLDERQLPPKQAFFNDLLQEAISEEDYAHAMNVWTSFDMETVGEYHDLYLKTDTLLLCDVFENLDHLVWTTINLIHVTMC